MAGSDMLKTDHGDIEYSVQGDGTPVLSLHGAGGGYDQGLWAAKMAFDDGYKIVSISRYGYLRTPIPKDASIKTQAGLYKDLLDCLNISKVIVFGVSAGGPSATQFANDYPERTQALVLLSAVSEAAAPGDKPAFYVGIIHLIPAIRLRVLVGRQVHATNYTQPDERQVHTRPKTTGAGNARYDASYDRTLSRHSERRGDDPA